jgi:putative ATP-dependent endonuclease of OLD family
MFLKSITIKNFRAIKQEDFTFRKGLNVIIGRNNTAKTAVIDALRICLSYGKQQREIYVDSEDFYIDELNPVTIQEPIEFHLIFALESPDETGIFYDLLASKDNGGLEIHFNLKYFYDTKARIRLSAWGGCNEGQHINSDVMNLFNFVYLNPLRDAAASLRPIRGNRIGDLFEGLTFDHKGNHINESRKKELANRIVDAVQGDDDWKSILEAGTSKIEDHLAKTVFSDDVRRIELDFLPMEYRRLVENIRMQFPIFTDELIAGQKANQKYFQLSQNGLGYNNLLYIATVFGDLLNRKEYFEPEAYYALLIEEPEAHLHPQLQNLFFRYMNELEEKGIQLFITSHSPTITSKVDM